MKKTNVSRSLTDVWKWKAALRRGLEDLPLEQALRGITVRANEAARRLGFDATETKPTARSAVAEAAATYRPSTRRRT
jgi:hypothetical protein